MSGVREVEVGETDIDVGREQPRDSQFGEGRVRNRRDDRYVVRTSDGDCHRGVARCGAAVRRLDGIGKREGLASGEEVELLGARGEVPGELSGGAGASDHAVAGEGEHPEHIGVDQGALLNTGDYDGLDAGGDRIGHVHIGEGQRAGTSESRIGLGQRRRAGIARGDGDDRCIVGTGEGDGDVAGGGRAGAVGDGDAVGRSDHLTSSQIIGRAVGSGEVPGDGTSVGGSRSAGARKREGVVEGGRQGRVDGAGVDRLTNDGLGDRGDIGGVDVGEG